MFRSDFPMLPKNVRAHFTFAPFATVTAQLTPQALDVCDGRREEHQIGGNFIVSEHMPGGMLGAAS